MPRYSVIVTRDLTQSVTVEVNADDEDEAQDKARQESYSDEYLGKWELDDLPAGPQHYTNGAELIR